MARISWSGLHEGEVLGIEPTGARVEVEEYLSFRLANGGIAELRWLGDDLDLLRQLGVELPIV
jgi:predicted ester cyclase